MANHAVNVVSESIIPTFIQDETTGAHYHADIACLSPLLFLAPETIKLIKKLLKNYIILNAARCA